MDDDDDGDERFIIKQSKWGGDSLIMEYTVFAFSKYITSSFSSPLFLTVNLVVEDYVVGGWELEDIIK